MPAPRTRNTGRCVPFTAIDDGNEFYGAAPRLALLPDGTAGVRLLYHDGEVVSAAVRDNVARYALPARLRRQVIRALKRFSRRAAGQLRARHLNLRRLRRLFQHAEQIVFRLNPMTAEWLDAQGTTIRSINPHLTLSDIGSEFSGSAMTGSF